MDDRNCLFCKIIRDEIPAKKAFEGEDVVAFEDVNPQAPTHILIVPRRHIAQLADLQGSDAEVIGKLFVRASEIARDRGLEDDGYRVVINNGEAAGQTVFHIHAHLLGGRAFRWPPG